MYFTWVHQHYSWKIERILLHTYTQVVLISIKFVDEKKLSKYFFRVINLRLIPNEFIMDTTINNDMLSNMSKYINRFNFKIRNINYYILCTSKYMHE